MCQQLSEQYHFHCEIIKDIEFVEMLADARYVIELYNRGYLYNEHFQQYLRHLHYIRKEPLIFMLKTPDGLLNLNRIRN